MPERRRKASSPCDERTPRDPRRGSAPRARARRSGRPHRRGGSRSCPPSATAVARGTQIRAKRRPCVRSAMRARHSAARRDEPRVRALAEDGDRAARRRHRSRAGCAGTRGRSATARLSAAPATARSSAAPSRRAGSCRRAARARVPDLLLRAPAGAPATSTVRARRAESRARHDVGAGGEREQREPDGERARRRAAKRASAGRRRFCGSADDRRARERRACFARRPRGVVRRGGAAPTRAAATSVAEELDLVLELDAELLAGAAARLAHQRDRVRRAGGAGVLDEVRVRRARSGRRRSGGPSARRPRASGRAVSSWSGFLKTLPKVRLFVGWAALRRACSSAPPP